MKRGPNGSAAAKYPSNQLDGNRASWAQEDRVVFVLGYTDRVEQPSLRKLALDLQDEVI
jgi:hypothetical protein